MSQPKHTPGPWTPAELDEDTWTKSSEIEGRSKHLNEPVCIIPHDDITDDGWQEVKANARLIAAAPEMLEALELGRKYLESRRTAADAADPDRFVFAEALRVAIAKATGGAE